MLGIDKAKPILRASIDGLNQGKFTEGHEKHLEQRAEPPPLRNDAVASLAMARRIELPIDRPHEARGRMRIAAKITCLSAILSISIRPHKARTRARTAPGSGGRRIPKTRTPPDSQFLITFKKPDRAGKTGSMRRCER